MTEYTQGVIAHVAQRIERAGWVFRGQEDGGLWCAERGDERIRSESPLKLAALVEIVGKDSP